MNFGSLKDTFTSILIESQLNGDERGKILYKKFLKILKENETLKTAFLVYKNLETNTIKSELAANEYLKESISLLENFKGDRSLTVQSKKLVSLLREHGVDIKSIPTKDIHKSIEDLIITKKTPSTLNKIHESRTNVVSWLMLDKKEVSDDDKFVVEGVDPNRFLDIAVKKFNDKYSDLNEEEKLIIKTIRENNSEELKQLFDTLFNENIQLVNNTLVEYQDNLIVKERLLETKDVIYKMKENEDSFGEKILKLYDLKSNLKNDE